jgi:SET domain-containing protein
MLFIIIIIILLVVGVNLIISGTLLTALQNPDKFYIEDSKIHGKGVFAAKDYIKDEFIEVGISHTMIIPSITKGFGTMINHSYQPTAYLKYANGNYNIHTLVNLKKGDEITINYNNTPWYIDGPAPHYK